jgi:hypothetical protein
MTQQEGRTLSLHDLARDHQWIRMLGWSDDQLRSVPVHEVPTGGDEMLNLSDFGGTGAGDDSAPTLAEARSIRNLYVYKSEAPADRWRELKQLVDQGGPSGYNTLRGSGEGGEAQFPPAGSGGP